MSAEIIQFPSRGQAGPTDLAARDCRNCVNARFGALTHCVLLGEDILSEESAAAECEAFELDEP